jgi:hypothetical protein
VTLTTAQSLGAGVLTLPDSRAYELVSPLSTQEVYVPSGVTNPEEDINTNYPFRASIDGNTVVYAGDPPSTGEGGTGSTGKGLGNEWLAGRNSEGWQASDITPSATGLGAQYEAFSSDLSVGIINSGAARLTADAPSGCADLYSRISSDGSYHALITSAQITGECEGPKHFAGASADGSHLLFQTPAALTSEAEKAAGGGKENLYDVTGGQLRSVNVLGGKPDPNATFGGPSGDERHDFSNAISADGARIFWTDLNTNQVYVRENGTTTIPVSVGAARFWTATPDGRYVFYTEGEALWRFDVDRFNDSKKPEPEALAEAREELTGAGAGVQGVIGVSRDGSYVYFVADGALAPGATPQTCKEPESGAEQEQENLGNLENRGCNLYLLRKEASVQFIATLAPEDNNLPGPVSEDEFGDWRADLGSRTAEVTPDGRHLVFASRQRLNGYHNGGSKGARPAVEAFLYDTEAGQLSCVSCDPSGAPPVEARGSVAGETSLPVSTNDTYMRRWINEEGNQVFFDTGQPLVPQDTNGSIQDVYEWEANGKGSCRQSGGCIYLLSGGNSTNNSYLADASANGNDVFFTTRGQLVPRDRNERIDLYDARVNGGFPEVSLACTGTGCQGVPPAPPTFAIPSSVTFNGVGNFTSSGPVVKSRSKPKKCKRGFVKKHGRCVRNAKQAKKPSQKRSKKLRGKR